jgi:hypothetical protein
MAQFLTPEQAHQAFQAIAAREDEIAFRWLPGEAETPEAQSAMKRGPSYGGRSMLQTEVLFTTSKSSQSCSG